MGENDIPEVEEKVPVKKALKPVPKSPQQNLLGSKSSLKSPHNASQLSFYFKTTARPDPFSPSNNEADFNKYKPQLGAIWPQTFSYKMPPLPRVAATESQLPEIEPMMVDTVRNQSVLASKTKKRKSKSPLRQSVNPHKTEVSQSELDG